MTGGSPMTSAVAIRTVNTLHHGRWGLQSTRSAASIGGRIAEARTAELGKQFRSSKIGWLVVWNMNFIFHNMLGIILPIDFHIFQRSWNHQPVGIYASKIGIEPSKSRGVDHQKWMFYLQKYGFFAIEDGD